MIKPKKSVQDMLGYNVPLFEREWDIKIDSNENLYGPSPKVIDAIKNILPDDIFLYPFYGELSRKIAEYVGFELENIKVTNGADEAIASIFQAYLEVGDAVLTVKPSFAMPVIYSQIVGAQLIEVPYDKKWEFPIDAFLSQLDNKQIKIVHITTPNNPTGESISETNLEKILKKSKDKLVLIDETYGNYCNSNYRKYVNEYSNVFIVKSFSKDFALAGLRLGYIISNKENIDVLKMVVSPFSVNSIAVKAGIAALGDSLYFENIKTEIEKAKHILKMAFESIGATVYPSMANFLCIDAKSKVDFLYSLLKRNNIIVKKFSSPEMEGLLRVAAPTVEMAKVVSECIKIRPTLVFDMDGVLIDAGTSYRFAIKKTFEYFANKEISYNQIQEIKNMGGLNNDWDLTEYLLKQENITVSKQDIVNKFQSFYWNDGQGAINNEELLIDKVLLEKLAQNYNLAIFTGRPRQEALFALEKNNITNLFFPIITMDDLPEDKQKPHSCGLDSVKSLIVSNCSYYYGDTIDDIACAVSAGFIPVGVLPPQDKSDALSATLSKKGAIIVLNNINDIKKSLEIDYEIQLKD